MFSGSLCALITPMMTNHAIDYAALKRLVDWHGENKTDGLVILGTTGESATIEPDERIKIIKQVITQVSENIPIIVGTGLNSTHKTIEFTKQAMELGADAVLLVTPYYNKPTQEGLYQHFKTISESVPIPQILYNVPSRTCCDLLPETVGRLSHFSNIVALKEATGKIERLRELLALNCQMDFFSGDDMTATEFMLAGGKGVISVAANVYPKAMHELAERAVQGDREQAIKMQAKLAPLFQALSAETNPIPTKWALSEMKMISSGIRLPLTPLSQKYHDVVRAALKELGLL